MKNDVILFDIDKTILDPKKLDFLINQEYSSIIGVPVSDIEQAELEYLATLKNDRDFLPQKYVEFMCQSFNYKNKKGLLDVLCSDTYAYVYKNSIYPDFLEFLNKLGSGYSLGIYSEGDKEFQNNKFKSMNLNKYFDPDLIFINDAKDTPEVVSKIPKGAMVVDDKESICDFLFKNKIKCIWLNRKDDKVSNKYPTIHNLLELPNLLLS